MIAPSSRALVCVLPCILVLLLCDIGSCFNVTGRLYETRAQFSATPATFYNARLELEEDYYVSEDIACANVTSLGLPPKEVVCIPCNYTGAATEGNSSNKKTVPLIDIN
tara:strand:- start:125 stop:451 length:327 start_codon:yes stop_codon:yes gene_type:complete